MNEYTFENLIMNPETPGLERLIEKKVYYGTAPLSCLKRANKDYEELHRKQLARRFFAEKNENGGAINLKADKAKTETEYPF